MSFVLFTNNEIIGIYETLDLLRHNCFSTNFKQFNDNEIDYKTYITVKKTLLNNEEITYENLKELVYQSNIFIDVKYYEKDGLHALQKIINHMRMRFDFLHEKMDMDSRVTVKFPGKDAVNSMMITHNIEENWRSLDPVNYSLIINELKKEITIEIQKLQLSYSTRVRFGSVSDRYASEISYQVWPADQENWNLPMDTNIPGGDFSECFKYQVEGVFGIVVDPQYGYNDL